VIDQERTDRSDTLNVGVNACRTALCMSLDADTLLEPSAISKAVFFMLTQPNTVCVGGCVYILNGCKFLEGKITKEKMPHKLLYGFQACEYMCSFLFFRAGWNTFGAMSYAGAFTCLQRDLIITLGGYENKNLAQDFEIITHIQTHIYENNIPYNIAFTPAAIAFTDVPGTFKEYWQQRYNWQYWMLHTLSKYKKMLFNPKYGSVGMITYPFFLFGETLGAVVEFTAYIMVFVSWYLGILDVYWVVLLLIVCWGFVMFLTIVTALINFMTFKQYKSNSDLFLMLFYIIIEHFGFRQFNVICRTYATFCYYIDVFKLWRQKSKGNPLKKDNRHD
jgi:biofilm PGA synthesis N-glycosyltransferase PgaC